MRRTWCFDLHPIAHQVADLSAGQRPAQETHCVARHKAQGSVGVHVVDDELARVQPRDHLVERAPVQRHADLERGCTETLQDALAIVGCL